MTTCTHDDPALAALEADYRRAMRTADLAAARWNLAVAERDAAQPDADPAATRFAMAIARMQLRAAEERAQTVREEPPLVLLTGDQLARGRAWLVMAGVALSLVALAALFDIG